MTTDHNNNDDCDDPIHQAKAGLAGLWGQDIDQGGTFWGVI